MIKRRSFAVLDFAHVGSAINSTSTSGGINHHYVFSFRWPWWAFKGRLEVLCSVLFGFPHIPGVMRSDSFTGCFPHLPILSVMLRSEITEYLSREDLIV